MISRAPILLVAWLLGLQCVRADATFDEAEHCGVGCVYGVLRVNGVGATVADVEKRIAQLYPATPHARLNVRQLCAVIESYGLHTRVARFRRADFGNVPPNTILYLRPDKVGRKTTGHVILLLNISQDGRARLVDFTPGVGRQTVTVHDLEAFWDGEAILVSRNRIGRYGNYCEMIAGFTLLLASSAYVIWTGMTGRRRAPAPRSIRP